MSSAPDPPPPSFIARVRLLLSDASPTERRLAEAVLDFPGELASYSASELAKYAHVSNATVSRFIRRLGYAGFDDARRHVRVEKAVGGPLFLVAAKRQLGEQSLEAHIAQGRANLAATFDRLTDADFTQMANAIVAARRVWMVGFRTSYAFALYFRWQIIQAIDGAMLFPGAGETIGEYLASLSDADCLVAFGLRRRVPQLDRITAHARASGAHVIYVTNQTPSSPVKANWIVRCETAAPGPLDNHVAVMAFCHLLATKVLEISGVAGRKRLIAVEGAHEDLAELAP